MPTSRAFMAVLRSKSVALVDTLHLPAEDVVALTLRLAVEYAAKAGMSAEVLHHQLDDLRAVYAIEGSNGAAMKTEAEHVIAMARALVAAVTTDDSGMMIGNQWTGGNGGLLSRETLVVADRLRLALDAHDQISTGDEVEQ